MPVSVHAGFNNLNSQHINNEYPLIFLFTIEVTGDQPIYITNKRTAATGIHNITGLPPLGIKNISISDVDEVDYTMRLDVGSHKAEAGVWVPSKEMVPAARLSPCEFKVAIQYATASHSTPEERVWTTECESKR